MDMYKVYALRGLGLLCIVWLLTVTAVQGQFYKPYGYLGGEVGGGFSNLLNQNNYGFPKMGYIPAVVTRFGLYYGVALRPWSRVQAGVAWQQVGYRFSDSYASGSSEPNVDLQKNVNFSLVQFSLTYRQFIIPRELVYVGTEKTIDLALKQRHSFFFSAGPQFSFFRQAEVTYLKRNAATANTWQSADIVDIKPAFDNYVPVELIPDRLPEDGRDLYRTVILSLIGGVGWQMHLSPELTTSLEVTGGISVNDFNANTRGPDGTYLWRRRVYSGSDPKAYFPSTMMTLLFSAGLEFRF